MAKKNKQPIIAPQPVAEKTAAPSAPQYGGNVPVQPASNQMQLAPIVQPIAFVPYSTMQQPLYQYEQAYSDVSSDFYGQQQPMQQQPAALPEAEIEAAPKKKARFVPIFLAILSLISIVVLILGAFVDAIAQYTAILDSKVGYNIVMDFVKPIIDGKPFAFSTDVIIPGSVALIALFSLLNFITCLCTMMKKGTCVFSKICLFFMLAFSLVIVISALIAKNFAGIGYGLYAVAGISLISFLIGYLAKKA